MHGPYRSRDLQPSCGRGSHPPAQGPLPALPPKPGQRGLMGGVCRTRGFQAVTLGWCSQPVWWEPWQLTQSGGVGLIKVAVSYFGEV